MRANNHVAAGEATSAVNRKLPEKARPLKMNGADGQARAPAQSAPRAEDLQPNQLLRRMSVEAHQDGMGLLLLDLNFKPIYASNAATSILHYVARPDAVGNRATVQEEIQVILQADRYNVGLPPRDFVSGRRRYICRSFLIESLDDGPRPPVVALMLERRPRDPLMLSDVARRFHLSLRETETVHHLIDGLTTKEAAQRMNISPNTVKQFVRLIMSKMSVTTRSGIIGKLLAGGLTGTNRAE
jgi:DNA-binding CsgD family transcriptional regulator